MNEIFDIITAVNCLADRIKYLSARIDNLCKNPALIAFDKCVDEATACKILKIGCYQLYEMRKKGEIEFIRHHRKILYPTEAVRKYLDSHVVKMVKDDTSWMRLSVY